MAHLAILLAVGLHVDTVNACSCEGPGIVNVLPAPGALGLPTNTRIYVPDFLVPPDAEYEITAAGVDGGTPPLVTVLSHRDIQSDVIVLTPADALEPLTNYEVRYWHRGRDEGALLSTFSTGAGADTTAPLTPEVSADSVWSYYAAPGDSCGSEYHGVLLDVSVGRDSLLTLVAFDGPAAYDPTRVDGELQRLTLADQTSIALGSGACSLGWQEARGGSQAGVQVATIDQAGNFSGWSERLDVELPATSGAPGCCHTQPSDNAATPLIGLLAVFVAMGGGVSRRKRAPGHR